MMHAAQMIAVVDKSGKVVSTVSITQCSVTWDPFSDLAITRANISSMFSKRPRLPIAKERRRSLPVGKSTSRNDESARH